MAHLIHSGVGRHRPNHPEDVEIVQRLLARHSIWLGAAPVPQPNGVLDEGTARAIEQFQRNAMSLLRPDGAVDRNGVTLRQLELTTIARPRNRVFLGGSFPHPPGELTEEAFTAAAESLDCELAALRAVAHVESRGEPWDEFGRPVILFERHHFRSWTHHRFDRSHPDISGPRGNYGRSVEQYPKLARAAQLDEDAALKSASWGTFQILGWHFAICGYGSVGAYVEAMLESQLNHLKAFVAFVRADHAMHRALQRRNWAGFAARYNGASYAENQYDVAMARAYRSFAPAARPIRSH